MTAPTNPRLGSKELSVFDNNEASGSPLEVIEDGERVLQFITFKIIEEEYGVNILDVREILAWSDVTRLPNTPENVRGVINLRGIIVPVFDLRCQFGMGLTEATPTHVIIIVLVDDRLVGILVDSVSEILSLNEDEISAVPETDLMVAEEFLAGLATADNRMVAIIDVKRLMGSSVLQNSVEQARSMAAKTEPHEDQ